MKQNWFDKLQQGKELKVIEKIDSEEFKEVVDYIGTASPDPVQLLTLVNHIPHFFDLMRTHVEGLKAAIEGASISQKQALSGISRQLDGAYQVMQTLASGGLTGAEKVQMMETVRDIAKLSTQVAEMQRKMNEENNHFWTKAASVVGAVVVTSVSVIGGLFYLTKKKD